MRVLWTIPAMVSLVLILLPVNEAFSIEWVNYDPQGDGQHWEWGFHREVMRATSGMLCGQVLAFAAGVWLAHRHRHPVALGLAASLGTVLGVVAFGTARLAAGERRMEGPGGVPLAEPRYWALVLAFPLFALLGVGVRRLLRSRGAPLAVLAGIGWFIMTAVGLLMDGRDGPAVGWLLALPPLAAARSIGLATGSVDAEAEVPVVTGDWGQAAAIALLCGLTGWVVLVNVLVGARSRSRAWGGTGGKAP